MTELQERRRTATVDDPRLALKERLTGAVILVALVVLLVPALLTGRRPDPPPRDAPTSGRSYEIDITGPARAPAEDPARPLPEPESMPAPVVAAAPVVTATPVTAPATGDQGVRVAPTGLPPSGGGVAPAAAVQSAVAAVSVGIVKGVPMLDLCYEEDSTAEVDFNVVMTGTDEFVEVQGTAEHKPFSRAAMDELMDLAKLGIGQLFELQKAAIAAS